MPDRPLPRATPETRHFWEGTRVGALRLQRCRACRACWLPPQPFCAGCGSADVEIFAASGRARLHSYVISHLPVPGYEPPFAIAVVELEEGPRLLTNLTEVEPDPERLRIDMPLEVVFETVSDDVALPRFRPARSP